MTSIVSSIRRNSVFLAVLLTFNLPQSQAIDLNGAYDAAVRNDAQFGVFQAGNQAQMTRSRQAAAGLLPNVGLNASYRKSFTESESTFQQDEEEQSSYGASASQALVRLDRYYSFRSAQRANKQAQFELSDAVQDLAVRTAEAYFNVLRAEVVLGSAKAEEKALQRQYEQTNQRYKVGLVAITDVHEAKAIYDNAKVSRLIAEGDIEVVREALELITGTAISQVSDLKEELPIQALDPQDVNYWVDAALKQNNQVQAAEYALQASELQLSSRKKQYWPSLDLVATYTDTQTDNDFTDAQTTVVGLQLEFPLWAGGLNRAQAKEARFLVEQARNNLKLSRNQTRQETRSLYTQINTNISTIAARKQSIISSQSALDANQLGYEVGTRNIVEVLDAQRALFAAERDYFIARIDYIINSLRFKKTQGTLNQADLQEINSWLKES